MQSAPSRVTNVMGKINMASSAPAHIDMRISKNDIDQLREAPMSNAGDLPSPDASACAIWNPSAAARWSLLFTPAFGAFIHMHNWHALGQPERAASARRWFYASLCLLALQIITSALNARLGSEPLLLHPLGLLFLLVWYFGAARQQTLLVKQRYGRRYQRKAWDNVLLGAVVAGAAYAFARTLLSLLLVALT